MINNNILNNPKSYTVIAMIIGYLMIADYTPLEQNAIGNWLMIIGQTLETNSAIALALKENNNTTFSDSLFNKELINKEDIDNLASILNDMINKLYSMKK